MSKATDTNINLIMLAEMLRQRDKQAMAQLYDQYAPLLYGIICRIVKTEKEAEEVLEQTFVYAWKNFTSYEEGKHTLCTWLIGVARAMAQKKVPFKMFVQNRDLLPLVSTTGGNADAGILPELADKTINLTPEQKTVLELVMLGGGRIEDVATHLEIEVTKVRQLLREALNHYRKELQQA